MSCFPLPSQPPKKMPSQRILVLDDEPNIGNSLRLILEREGYAVTIARSIADAKSAASTADALVLDVRLPDGSGIDFLRQLRERDCTAPAIMISGHGTIAEAVEATRAGAFDFLEKPLGRDRVLLSLKNALEQATLRRENERLRELVGAGAKMIGSSPAFIRVVEQASMAARSDARILISGESGTGKELLAAHIHRESPFSNGPFVKVNCAAIPSELLESELFGHEKGAFTGAISARKGKFELADGGTIFLDEVGDLHAGSQAKLLRVLAGRRIPPRRRRADHPRFGPRDCRHQSQSRRPGGPAKVPRRLVLPALRRAHPRSSAARASSGHPDRWRTISWKISARATISMSRRSIR